MQEVEIETAKEFDSRGGRRFVVTLREAAGNPWTYRSLAKVLKELLRVRGFRCVAIRELQPGDRLIHERAGERMVEAKG
jgi:hypothetical protein